MSNIPFKPLELTVNIVPANRNYGEGVILVVYSRGSVQWSELAYPGEPLHTHLQSVVNAWGRYAEQT